MVFRYLAKASAGLLFVFAAMAASAGDLGPGSAAPKLEVKKWLKGSPIAKLEANKTYVVEFWATWCGPCIESIPHVTELAKKNQDVTFIGVGIWEDDEGDKLPKFVAGMGEKMGYNVGYSGNKDGMAASWMDAAAQNGIPTAFIVKDQKVMWIGHPMGLDKPLAEVKAGTFDLSAFKKSFDRAAEANRKQMAADKEFSEAVKLHDTGKPEEAKKALEKVVAKYPTYAKTSEAIQYGWLADEDPAAWSAKTKGLLESGKDEDLFTVAGFALRKAQTPAGADKARSAIAMVLKADKKNNFDVLMYAQTVYTKLGDLKDALEITNKMIEAFPTSPAKDHPQFKEILLKNKAELEAKIKAAG